MVQLERLLPIHRNAHDGDDVVDVYRWIWHVSEHLSGDLIDGIGGRLVPAEVQVEEPTSNMCLCLELYLYLEAVYIRGGAC